MGTTHTKAVLVDDRGAEVAWAVRRTPFRRTSAGVEADVDSVLATVAQTVADLGAETRRVASVGIAGLAESGAPVDRAGVPLAPVIAWHDPRGSEAVATLEERFGAELSLAIGQELRTVSSVAKLGWLASNGVDGLRWWLGVPELCLHHLTGQRATDFSLAARTGAYDVGRRRPMPEVPAALGLPDDVFVEPSPAGTVMGTVSARGAVAAGLPPGVPVTVAGHDHLAGATGCGAVDVDLVNSVGTAETVVGRPSGLPDVRRALDRRVAVTVRPQGEGWAVLASGARAGLVLDVAARALGRPPAELDALAEGAGAVDMTAWVEAVAEAVRASTIPDEPAAGAGDIPDGPPGAVWNGVVQALAQRTWDAARRVQEVTGPAPRLVVFGGGSRSRPWLRAKAEAGELEVVRSTAVEAVARGAAVFAGVAAGWWGSADTAPRPEVEAV